MSVRQPCELPVRLLDRQNRPYTGAYLLRLQGWTPEDYLRLAPENAFVEFVRGEVLMASPVSALHQEVAGFLYALLRAFLKAHKREDIVLTGPVAVQILPDVVREPDVFVLPPEAKGMLNQVPLPVVPRLVIEGTRTSTRTVDLVEKPLDYAQAGVPEYWVMDIQEKAVIQHLPEPGSRYTAHRVVRGWVASRVLPGFRVKVEWLFPRPDLRVQEALQAMGEERGLDKG